MERAPRVWVQLGCRPEGFKKRRLGLLEIHALLGGQDAQCPQCIGGARASRIHSTGLGGPGVVILYQVDSRINDHDDCGVLLAGVVLIVLPIRDGIPVSIKALG